MFGIKQPNAGTKNEDCYFSNGWLLNFEYLMPLASNRREVYEQQPPFPHLIISELIKPAAIDKILAEFPSASDQIKWHEREATLDNGSYASLKKKDSADFLQMGPITRQLIWELNSRPFIQFLQRLTGIPRLISDPLTYGGGLHETHTNGLLKVHADFQKHPLYGLDRRINVIVYLNKDWPEEFGGHLELWNEEMTECVERVLPTAGVCVIFNTNPTSFHGHPQPLTCPVDRSRKSIALYYYSNGRDDSKKSPQSYTDWKDPVI
ncbi:2OG-Fe(II) oxygenase [Halioxenophilus sp. WMMB6]|uniref:2OG-Fe(II) oxygenase n=1 Tax=Halioxenophilus sp. WMMB6 TaxID=3073815 RepID=UPI00295E3B72|nr:2OG-Fe(II) oxygenase [Halioxenophilus sp. WMMB6]